MHDIRRADTLLNAISHKVFVMKVEDTHSDCVFMRTYRREGDNKDSPARQTSAGRVTSETRVGVVGAAATVVASCASSPAARLWDKWRVLLKVHLASMPAEERG